MELNPTHFSQLVPSQLRSYAQELQAQSAAMQAKRGEKEEKLDEVAVATLQSEAASLLAKTQLELKGHNPSTADREFKKTSSIRKLVAHGKARLQHTAAEWKDLKRTYLICKEILGQRYLYAAGKSTFEAFPHELVEEISTYLPDRDLVNLNRTSKTLSNMTRDKLTERESDYHLERMQDYHYTKDEVLNKKCLDLLLAFHKKMHYANQGEPVSIYRVNMLIDRRDFSIREIVAAEHTLKAPSSESESSTSQETCVSIPLEIIAITKCHSKSKFNFIVGLIKPPIFNTNNSYEKKGDHYAYMYYADQFFQTLESKR